MIVMLLAVFTAAAFTPLLFRYLGRNAFFLISALPAVGFLYTLFLGTQISADRSVVERIDWVHALDMDIVLRTDTLGWILSLLVTGVGWLVMVYCARYFSDHDPETGRFAAVLLAFFGMMYGLVVADNVYLLFLFWEGTTVFSYLLIGTAQYRQQARRAALQALIVTTTGGLAMLVGLVMMHLTLGTALLSGMVREAQRADLANPVLITAVMLVLIGAVSKSALVPFHFWLPGAMAAPTPVSAYLHAAAMVKAGIYLVLRLAPGFSEQPGWVPVLVILGGATMLVGGWRAIRQTDLKLVLAFGTVSQLGMLTMISAFGTRNTTLAALAMLLAHGLFKATLFLVVGIIDHRTGTRDLRKLSGLGRQAPVLMVVGVIAALSMSGIPPLMGFVAKEAVYSSFLEVGTSWAIVAVCAMFIGSVFTVAYSFRFIWGAFAGKPHAKECRYVVEHFDFLIAPAILAVLTVLGGLMATQIDAVLVPAVANLPDQGYQYELALWHGLEPALLLSLLSLLLGAAVFHWRDRVAALQAKVPAWVDLHSFYRRSMMEIERMAAFVTAKTQRGSLPFYQAVILAVLVLALAAASTQLRNWPIEFNLFDQPMQLLLLVVMGTAALAVTRIKRRFMAVIVTGIVGYGMVGFFALQGAPDLALTQLMVETITLVVFMLVLRRLPARIGSSANRVSRRARAVLAGLVGAITVVVAWVLLSARQAVPVSVEHPRLAYEGGHGMNVVNVILVDIRAWDTLGELSVVVVAATGVASLIFVTNRTARLQRLRDDRPARLVPVDEELAKTRLTDLRRDQEEAEKRREQDQLRADEAQREQRAHRNAWLLAGRSMPSQNRSIILEVITRLMFHSIIVFSIYLLLAGHNLPGGGFAAGLVAGGALVLRYLAGGRFELAEAAPLDAGRALGLGLVIAVGIGLAGFFFDAAIMSSTWFTFHLPIIGKLEIVTTTIFDIGVYLIVLGLMLDVLRSLGAEVDRQQEEDDEHAKREDVLGEGDMARRLATRDAGHGESGPRGGYRL